MRIRALAGILFVGILLFVSTTPEPTRVQAFFDGDRDGLDDNFEFQLAWNFYPVLWISNADQCPNPNPRQVLFRARHPSVFGNRQTNYIVINYVQLYDEDCGDGRHNGDNEPYEVWLRWNGSSWVWGSVSAVAHWGTGYETRTWSYTPELWAGANKHGTYADPNECGVPFSEDDKCGGLARVLGRQLYNVGEPYEWLLNNLGQVRSYWGDERVWDDGQFLSAGNIRGQLFHNHTKFYTPFTAPLPYNCSGNECWDGEGREWVPPPANPPSNDVVFYEHIDYVGQSFGGSSDFPFVGWDWNDRISSIRIPAGRTVVLYEHIDFGGESITLTSDVSDLRDIGYFGYGWWNDQVSSIRIY